MHSIDCFNKSTLNLFVLLQDNLRQRIIQDVITIVVKSDKNNDQSIDRVEAKVLALRIRLALQEYGVEFDAEKFLMAIRRDPSVTGVIAIAQKLLAHDGGDEHNEEDDMFDMFYLAGDENDSRKSLFRASSVKKMGEKQMSELTCDETEITGQFHQFRGTMRRSSTSRRYSIMSCDMDEIIRISNKCACKSNI
jgi:hypothetical protein